MAGGGQGTGYAAGGQLNNPLGSPSPMGGFNTQSSYNNFASPNQNLMQQGQSSQAANPPVLSGNLPPTQNMGGPDAGAGYSPTNMGFDNSGSDGGVGGQPVNQMQTPLQQNPMLVNQQRQAYMAQAQQPVGQQNSPAPNLDMINAIRQQFMQPSGAAAPSVQPQQPAGQQNSQAAYQAMMAQKKAMPQPQQPAGQQSQAERAMMMQGPQPTRQQSQAERAMMMQGAQPAGQNLGQQRPQAPVQQRPQPAPAQLQRPNLQGNKPLSLNQLRPQQRGLQVQGNPTSALVQRQR